MVTVVLKQGISLHQSIINNFHKTLIVFDKDKRLKGK